MGGALSQGVFSVCFFLMIIMLGIGSQFVGVEGFVTAVVDVVPGYLRVGYRRQIFVAIVTLISYLIGLTMVTNVSRSIGKWNLGINGSSLEEALTYLYANLSCRAECTSFSYLTTTQPVGCASFGFACLSVWPWLGWAPGLDNGCLTLGPCWATTWIHFGDTGFLFAGLILHQSSRRPSFLATLSTMNPSPTTRLTFWCLLKLAVM